MAKEKGEHVQIMVIQIKCWDTGERNQSCKPVMRSRKGRNSASCGGFKQRLEGGDQVSCGAGRWKR